jgi:hypothetical protein
MATLDVPDDGELGTRPGLPGVWDGIVGPGAGPLENLGTLGAGVVGALCASALARGGRDGPAARLVLRLLALDLWGGAWCNATPAAARWYGRPGQGTRHLMVFAAGHLHPFVVAWLDHGRGRWRWAAVQYGYLLVATALVARCGVRVRPALGLLTAAAGVLLDRRLGPSGSAPWFAPVFHVKLLAGHAGGAGRIVSACSSRAPTTS